MIDIPPILQAVYGVTGPAMSLAYLPQIYRVYKDRSGAKSISIFTWVLWTISLFITTLYGLVVSKDSLFFLSSLMSCVGCFLVALMASIRRYQYARRARS